MANGITNISGGKALSGTAQPSDVRLGMTYADGKALREGTLDLRNLKAENIKKDVNIAGVVGTMKPRTISIPRIWQYVGLPGEENKTIFRVPSDIANNRIRVLMLSGGYNRDVNNRARGSILSKEMVVTPGEILDVFVGRSTNAEYLLERTETRVSARQSGWSLGVKYGDRYSSDDNDEFKRAFAQVFTHRLIDRMCYTGAETNDPFDNTVRSIGLCVLAYNIG